MKRLFILTGILFLGLNSTKAYTNSCRASGSWWLSAGLGQTSYDRNGHYQFALERKTVSRFYWNAQFRQIPHSKKLYTSFDKASQLHFNVGSRNCLGLFTFKNFIGYQYRWESLSPALEDQLGSYDLNSGGLVSGVSLQLNSGIIEPFAQLEYSLFGDGSDWTTLHFRQLNTSVNWNIGVAIRLT
ncbi:MAG: hypothetical protein KDC92_06295 [Bacteroidetes bacterium]|nr:hypothetical protein [Bacteroidota bacterium]